MSVGLRGLRALAVFAAVFAFAALAGASFHVLPTSAGVWRGVFDPPGAARFVLAAVAGLLAALLQNRRPALFFPLVCLGLAAAPLAPLATGRALPLLLFQGPALLVVAAVAAALAGLPALLRSGRPWSPARAFLVAALAFLALGSRLPGPAGAQGDEPHYLTMAESLRSDLDLDLRDEFRRHEYRAFYAGDLAAHTSPLSPRGKLYAIHAPGLPALVLPAYVVAGEAGVRLLLVLLAAATAALVFALVRDVMGDEPAARACLLALALGAPFAFYANQVYPELPAALATALFLHSTRRDPGSARLLVAGGVAFGLVWLHPKFLPLAFVGVALTAVRRGPVPWRAGALLLFASGVTTLLSWMNATYGAASLTAAYGSGADADVQLGHIPRGLLGLLLDREFGLLVHAPLWTLAALGFLPLWRQRAGDLIRALLLAAPVVAVGAAYSMWWGGSCPPGRFLVPALPALALLLAPAWLRKPRLFAALFGLGLGVLAVAALQPRALHNRADGESALWRVIAPGLRLGRALPSFVGSSPAWQPRAAFEIDVRGAALRALWLWDGANARSASGSFRPEAVVIPLLDNGPWALAASETRGTPRVALPPGSYEVHASGELQPGVRGRLIGLVVTLDGEDVARSYFGSEERAPVIALELPAGARRVEVWATGVRSGASLTAIDLVPRRLAPRSRRAPDAPGPSG